MKIVKLCGGLGIQSFEYIFGRTIEIELGEKVIFDDSYFQIDALRNVLHSKESRVSNKLLLEEVFNIEIKNKLSNYFSRDVWEDMMRKYNDSINEMIPRVKNEIPKYVFPTRSPSLAKNNIQQQLLERGVNITVIHDDVDRCYFTGNSVRVEQYTPSVIKSVGDFYFNGSWVSKYWFQRNSQILEDEFSFKHIICDGENFSVLKQIESSHAIAVQIRHFDHLESPPYQHFAQWISSLREKRKDLTYFVFSDDFEEIKKNLFLYGFLSKDEIIFVEGNNTNETFHIDLQLMSKCKYLIHGGSSFAALSYVLRCAQPPSSVGKLEIHRRENQWEYLMQEQWDNKTC